MPRPSFVEHLEDGKWLLRVRVQPGAKKSTVEGPYGEGLKIRIAAPAVDNKANKALTEYVAGLLGLKKRDIALEKGEKSRDKVLGITSEDEPNWTRLTAG